MSTPPPAGWYNDPAGSDGKRWFDGERWTDKVNAPAVEVAAESPTPARALLTGQKGGGVFIVFSALAAIVASIIVAVYFGELSGASRYNQPDPGSLAFAAVFFGISGLLFTVGIYRAVEQVDEMYSNILAQQPDAGPTIAEAMAQHARDERDAPGA